MCGLAKYEAGELKKAVKTSVAVITNYGEESEALTIVRNHLAAQN